METIGAALASQFECAFGGLRDIIAKLPDEEWYEGASYDQVPARRVHHALMYVGRYCRPKQGEHPSGRGATPREAYRSREEMLAYLEEVARQVRASLSRVGDDRFLRQSYGRATLLEHWVFNLRHFQHHVGQLSSTLRERRLNAMKWH